MSRDQMAIEVRDVHKRFRRYSERHSSLKSLVLSRSRRARYDEFQALDGVSFSVAPGETFGLVGSNGSGKSTMLKCLAGILVPESGSISTRGRVASLLELGSGFHPELSGRDNVFLNASILGLSRKETRARFDEIVEFSGIGPFIDTPVKNYSSGMYVRLGFSVAIHVRPDVFLVDEVLAVGDEQFQRKCVGKFAELQELGTTIVLVTHSMGQVLDLCHSAVWLDRGVPRALGAAEDVVAAYLDEQDELGSGHEVIKRAKLALRWPDGRRAETVPSETPLVADVTFELARPTDVVDVRVELLDNRGIPVVDGKTVVRPGGELSGSILADLPPVPLRPGEYLARAWLDAEGQPKSTYASARFAVEGAEKHIVILSTPVTFRRAGS